MSGKRVARHAQTKNHRNRAVIGAAVAAVAVVAVLALVLGWLPGSGSDDTDEASSQSSGSADPTPSDSGGSASPTPSPDETSSTTKAQPSSRVRRACATSIGKAETAVAAASQGVTNWDDHVQARTDMLDGSMSVERMDAIWARTRAAGPSDQERFKKVLPASEPSSRCEELTSAPASDQEMTDRCLQRSMAATRALEAAEAAMKDWETHLANMAMFADKEMSASMAQTKWVKAWRNAPKNISAYRDARAALAEAPTCPDAAS